MASLASDQTTRNHESLRLSQRLTMAARIARLRFREHLDFDSRLFKVLGGSTAAALGGLLFAAGCRSPGFSLLARLHRSGSRGLGARLAEHLARSAARQLVGGIAPNPLVSVYKRYVEDTAPDMHSAKFFKDPARLLQSLAIVVKSPRDREKGVIIINYLYIFPIFARLFDIYAIANRYHLVLEPSWSGYCNLDILSYSRHEFPVFIEAYEPWDAAFIERSRSNLIPVGTSTNWWVDHRIFRPRPEIAKDVDVIMVASWADFKRHHRFFAALRAMRRRVGV